MPTKVFFVETIDKMLYAQSFKCGQCDHYTHVNVGDIDGRKLPDLGDWDKITHPCERCGKPARLNSTSGSPYFRRTDTDEVLAVYLAYRGSLASLITIIATVGFLVITRSRTPLAAGCIALLLSVFLLAPSWLKFGRLVGGLFFLALAAGGVASQFQQPVTYAAETWSRLTGSDVDVAGRYIEAEAPDPTREHINEESLRLLSDYNPLGIGYENFPSYYDAQYWEQEAAVLHSMYATWVLELGIPGLLIVVFIALETIRRLRLIYSEIARPVAIGIVTACLMGFFHQAHQSPGLWIMLGLCFGLANVEEARASHQALVSVTGEN